MMKNLENREESFVKISVIIPVYNAAQHLEECLDSVCNQTLKEIEIICVNDGSTDNSLDILQKYGERDCRIKILSQKNQYAGVARNNGMKYARGKYLSFLDADDYFAYDMLERMYRRAEEEDADAVLCRYRELDEATDEIAQTSWDFIDRFFDNKRSFAGTTLHNAGIFQITRGWAWDKLFRRTYVEQCGYQFSTFRSSEDGFFTYMLLAQARKLTYMDDILITHRMNQMISLSSTKEKNWVNGFRMLLLLKEEMEKQDIYEIYEMSFINEIVNFVKWYLSSMHTYEAYRNCYIYIQMILEAETGILKREKSYFFKEEWYDWYQKIMEFSLEEYLFRMKEKMSETILQQQRVLNNQWKELQDRDWLFPFSTMEIGKTVVLYGAGKMGKTFYKQLIDSQFCKEIVWVDKQYQVYASKGMDVRNPDEIFGREFDYVFLAVRSREVQNEIEGWLEQKGVSPDKIRRYFKKVEC